MDGETKSGLDAAAIVTLANAALALVEQLIPAISQMVKSGEISVQDQQALLDRYNAVKTAADNGFVGPEWEQSGKA